MEGKNLVHRRKKMQGILTCNRHVIKSGYRCLSVSRGDSFPLLLRIRETADNSEPFPINQHGFTHKFVSVRWFTQMQVDLLFWGFPGLGFLSPSFFDWLSCCYFVFVYLWCCFQTSCWKMSIGFQASHCFHYLALLVSPLQETKEQKLISSTDCRVRSWQFRSQ